MKRKKNGLPYADASGRKYRKASRPRTPKEGDLGLREARRRATDAVFSLVVMVADDSDWQYESQMMRFAGEALEARGIEQPELRDEGEMTMELRVIHSVLRDMAMCNMRLDTEWDVGDWKGMISAWNCYRSGQFEILLNRAGIEVDYVMDKLCTALSKHGIIEFDFSDPHRFMDVRRGVVRHWEREVELYNLRDKDGGAFRGFHKHNQCNKLRSTVPDDHGSGAILVVDDPLAPGADPKGHGPIASC